MDGRWRGGGDGGVHGGQLEDRWRATGGQVEDRRAGGADGVPGGGIAFFIIRVCVCAQRGIYTGVCAQRGIYTGMERLSFQVQSNFRYFWGTFEGFFGAKKLLSI